MKIVNNTRLAVEERLRDYVGRHDTRHLLVELKHTKAGAKTQYSGVFVHKDAKIRVSINPGNRYPLKVRVGSPFDRSKWEHYRLDSAEELAAFIFLHEFSHYLDYCKGIPTRGKQTKADLYALEKMGKEPAKPGLLDVVRSLVG